MKAVIKKSVLLEIIARHATNEIVDAKPLLADIEAAIYRIEAIATYNLADVIKVGEKCLKERATPYCATIAEAAKVFNVKRQTLSGYKEKGLITLEREARPNPDPKKTEYQNTGYNAETILKELKKAYQNGQIKRDKRPKSK